MASKMNNKKVEEIKKFEQQHAEEHERYMEKLVKDFIMAPPTILSEEQEEWHKRAKRMDELEKQIKFVEQMLQNKNLDIFPIIESEEKGQLKDLNPSIGTIYNQVKIVDGKIVGIEATFILKDKKDGKDNWEKIG